MLFGNRIDDKAGGWGWGYGWQGCCDVAVVVVGSKGPKIIGKLWGNSCSVFFCEISTPGFGVAIAASKNK